jgi:HEAT repeats
MANARSIIGPHLQHIHLRAVPAQIGAFLNLRIRQTLFFSVLTISAVSFGAVKLWARLMLPPSMADVRDLADKAPIVFRGRVAQIISHPYLPDSFGVDSLATIHVDRLYRGSVPENLTVHFLYNRAPLALQGHNCIDFEPDTYWLVFAVEKAGRLELFDDCGGALAISPLLGPRLKDFDWLAQMEADFLAGLNDASAANRVVSIQRLGGLKLPSAQSALHRIIDKASKEEANWAVYAALRGGDFSVMPQVKQILANGDMTSPQREIAFELKNVSDSSAVPILIEILANAPGELTRTSVLTALGENIKDPRAVPILANHLSAADESLRYLALVGLWNIAQESACSPSDTANEQNLEARIRRCKLWWEERGKFQSWGKD